MAKKIVKKPAAPRRAARPAPRKTLAKAARTAGKVTAVKVMARSVVVAVPSGRAVPKSAKVKVGDRDAKRASKLAAANHAPPVIIPRPVPTDGKPRKNQAGMSSKELEHYRELLLMKRRELVGDMSSMEREALRSTQGSNLSNLPLHMADMGTDNYEQEFTLGLVEKDRQLLREINRALAKIMDGTFGICEGTGKPISKPRLEAQPWAKYSIEYARQLERGMIRR